MLFVSHFLSSYFVVNNWERNAWMMSKWKKIKIRIILASCIRVPRQRKEFVHPQTYTNKQTHIRTYLIFSRIFNVTRKSFSFLFNHHDRWWKKRKERQQGVDDEKKTGMKERERKRGRLSPSLERKKSTRPKSRRVSSEKKEQNGRALAEKKFSRQGISRFEVP